MATRKIMTDEELKEFIEQNIFAKALRKYSSKFDKESRLLVATHSMFVASLSKLLKVVLESEKAHPSVECQGLIELYNLNRDLLGIWGVVMGFDDDYYGENGEELHLIDYLDQAIDETQKELASNAPGTN